jgi:hypothetical protein
MSKVELNFESINRWEPTGLLDNLPLWEKEELSMLYDNMVRLTLASKSIYRIPNDVYELLNDVNIPTIRRLYRRVGPNFDIEEMMSKLLAEIEKKKDFLRGDITPESNPIVEFCVEFADNYEDEKTLKKQLTKEEYTERIDFLLKYLRDVLLNEDMVTKVNKGVESWDVKISDKKKSQQFTRFWNQKMGKELLIQSLSDINKE